MSVIKNIKGILRKIKEAYRTSMLLKSGNMDIFENSDSREVLKLLSEVKELRYTVDSNDNYYMWDSTRATHEMVENHIFGYDLDSTFKGRIIKEEVLIYAEFAYDYLELDYLEEIKDMTPEEREDYDKYVYTFKQEDYIVEEFMQTKIYNKVIKYLNIDEIRVVRWI